MPGNAERGERKDDDDEWKNIFLASRLSVVNLTSQIMLDGSLDIAMLIDNVLVSL